MHISLDSLKSNKKLQARLQQKLLSLGVLSSGVAHEIGTPLAVIQGRAEMISRGHLSDKEIQQSAELIYCEVDRIKKIIFLLLDLGKKEENIVIDFFDLKKLIDDVLVFFETRVKESQIDIRFNFSEGSAELQSDRVRFQKILVNLILNAVQAIEKQKNKDATKSYFIQFNFHRTDQNKIKFSIEDNGCGMSSDVLGSIFNPFFTTHDIGEAIGLGLPLSFKLCDELGLELDVESIEGVGSVFSLFSKA